MLDKLIILKVKQTYNKFNKIKIVYNSEDIIKINIFYSLISMPWCI